MLIPQMHDRILDLVLRQIRQSTLDCGGGCSDPQSGIFESSIRKTLYDLKEWLYVADANGFKILNCDFDVLIAYFLQK